MWVVVLREVTIGSGGFFPYPWLNTVQDGAANEVRIAKAARLGSATTNRIRMA